MDIATYLQCFEDSLTSYTGDDPLDPWEKFVEFLEQRLPAEGDRGMSQVFDSLVQRFLTVERYADDVRYIRYCIKCASYYSDPVVLYSHIFSKGIGTRSAALYVAWAQQFEQRGMNEQADAVYQKAVENQAQPADTLLHEYRQFQTRTRTQLPVSGGRNPLQNSQLANQMPPSWNMVSADCPSNPPGNKMIVTVSRSETSGSLSSRQDSSVPTVSAYTKEDLVCEGSELCFEEVRAMKYFQKLQEKQKKEQSEIMERRMREEIQRMKAELEKLNQQLEVRGDVSSQTSAHQTSAAQTNSDLLSQPFARPRPSNHRNSRRSLGLRLHTEPPFIHEAAAVPEPPLTSDVSHHSSVLSDSSALKSEATPLPSDPQSVVQTSAVQQNVGFQRASMSLLTPASFPAVGSGVPSLEASLQLGCLDTRQPPEQERSLITESEAKLDASQGGTANLSHITPNSSLGFVQATPSRVLPSPTVNTQEALGVIMDMFQAPTFLEDPFSSASQLHATQTDFNVETNEDVAVVTKPPTTAPFTIFQDDDKENFSAAASSATDKSKPVRGLSEFAVPKADKPNETSPDLMPDESTVWGSRHNSLAACPNSTSDFAMLAQFVSTPFTHKTFFAGTFFADQETNCDVSAADNGASLRCQTKKLSPIMEQSPCDDKDSESTVSQLALSSARQGTIVGEVLASAQHCLTTSSITMVQPPPPVMLSFRDSSRSAGPSWEVYTSPERPPKPASPSPVGSTSRPFQILEDLEQRVQSEARDVPMSPECAPGPGWLAIRSPEATAGPDLDAFLSPRHPKKEDTTSNRTLDVLMSPEQPQLCADVPMSPLPPNLHSAVDEPMMSPHRGVKPGADVQLVSDPWDNNLISHLLSTLNPPLFPHPRCITWQCNIPTITPKMTISIGNASLRVDCVLGLGAFATVYQATDPRTSEKMVLKVQKAANAWEFYINTRLDARLQPAVRHLFDRVRSAHLFNNGSVLLSELHNYGTLLNAVNMYKTQSDKVMPQPLVLYFTVCILHMVEQLHAAHLIHADVKPDNFMLGERFLDNKCFDSESVDHGLVLIDLGQSIDMELFPEGTAFTARCLTSGFQCTEMLSGRPWNYQTDYFGIAGTVYCMLFGTYMQVTNEGGMWKTNGLFRRNPHADLWLDFFHTLLNVSDCSSPPCLRSLRCKLTSVLQTNYSSKLPMLKSRLVVLLLENHKAGRR